MTVSFMPDGPWNHAAPPQGFAELSTVALTRAVRVGEVWSPVGAWGTVVAVYAGGAGYEVEFEQPHAVVTLAAGDLAA